jgi:RNA polymerase sigma factor for flagellar operon FliA
MKSGGSAGKKLPADAPEVVARVSGALSVVRFAARKIRRQLGTALDFDELYAMGNLGLLDAARTYDAEYGVRFEAWAYLKVRGAIIDGLRKQGDLPRAIYSKLRAFEAANHVRAGQVEDEAAAASETPEAADQRVAATTATMAMAMAAAFLSAKRTAPETIPDEKMSPENATSAKILLERVRESIDRLPDAERTLLVKCYFEDCSLEEAGKSIGLSKSWVSRLHARALETVAKDLKKRKIQNDE